ncbi:chemotaxis protein CheX [Marinibactrum halimedae]|uniref:Chemotaxis protein CheX n=1 Tax=Marinibactrum halimedae TaxID=1444977 RepID=A0AA37WQH7_9GAMM|nr:chemotaxis protein CheX [Marinibactrum halimedae]MCD9459220.1 chemotaxis protein CheX [Marinibactrum halimedae]GLS27292.1 hypothetical protein GCM10007877_30110 [Marinibactrum halimedae]
MESEAEIVSKVFAYDADPTALSVIKNFCDENNLVGFREHYNKINKVFDCNIDLGAVFLSETLDDDGKSGIDLAVEIHKVRPELPLVLRRLTSATFDGLSEDAQSLFAGVYTLEDLSPLKSFLQDHLFNRYYPTPLVHGIQEITQQTLSESVRDSIITKSSPCLVKHHIIYGEVFSMIPLESSWCKGYMMIQTTDEDISNVIRSGNTSLPSKINNESLDVNQLLNEITNVIWGRIKSQFFTEEHNADVGGSSIQVPILVNHAKKFISFGATEPQLCFTYTVEDTQNRYKPFTLNQKIIFNLSWMPENMNISEQILSDSVESGELELF